MFSELFLKTFPTWVLLAEWGLCGAFVLFLGAQLTRRADNIAEAFGLARGWVGLLLLATITSVPELVTSGTAVWLGQPDLAIGNVYGSCCFNIAIISLLNAVRKKGSLLTDANTAHVLSSAFGIILMIISMLMLVAIQSFGQGAAMANPTEWTVAALIFVTYLACMRMMYKYEKQQALAAAGDVPVAAEKPKGLVGGFALTGVLVIVASIWLTKTGDVLQDHPIDFWGGRKLGGSFVGLFFLAIATSLPEIVTSFAAVRLGHVDLALGNLFGSNMFNIIVIPFMKLTSVVRGRTVMFDAASFHFDTALLAGGLAILLTGIAISGVTYRSKRKLFRFGFDSILIALVYLAGMYFMLVYQ